MKRRVNCFIAGCEQCKKGIFVKKNYWGEKLYICSAYPEKHKAISGMNCGMFRCNGAHNSILCENCRKGK